jgi:NDP-sugar pyrophosphorylase family protein
MVAGKTGRSMIQKAMILAAGLGSRLKPWTDQHPKALAPVNGKSLLQRNIEYLQSFGMHEVIVNVHHFADQIIAALENNHGWGSRITISDETGAVLETGGGLQKAAWFFQDTDDFVLMNVDVLTDLNLTDMIRHHFDHHALATLAVSERATSRYFLFNTDMRLCGWRNKSTGEEKLPLAASPLQERAFSGLHIIRSEMLDKIRQTGKFSMVDVYLDLAGNEIIQGYDHTGCRFVDVGKPDSIDTAEKMFPVVTA